MKRTRAKGRPSLSYLFWAIFSLPVACLGPRHSHRPSKGGLYGHCVGSQSVCMGHHGRRNNDPLQRPLRSELDVGCSRPWVSQAGQLRIEKSSHTSYQLLTSAIKDSKASSGQTKGHCLRDWRIINAWGMWERSTPSSHTQMPYGVRERRRQESWSQFEIIQLDQNLVLFLLSPPCVWELMWNIRSVLGK